MNAVYVRCLSVTLMLVLGACANAPVRQNPAPVSTSSPAVIAPERPMPESPVDQNDERPLFVGPVRTPDSDARPNVIRPDTTTTDNADESPAQVANTPSAALLVSVDNALSAGDPEGAAAMLERALRITPRDPHLWYRLAMIRFDQQRWQEAEGFARRARGLSGSDAALARQIDALLVRISAARS